MKQLGKKSASVASESELGRARNSKKEKIESSKGKATRFGDAYHWSVVRTWRQILIEAPNKYRRDLEEGKDVDYQFKQLEEQWQRSLYPKNRTRWDRHPSIFDALTGCLQDGYVPPPELLIAIMMAYQDYLSHKGRLSADEVFFGPPKRKLGNRAGQHASWWKSAILNLYMTAKIGRGQSPLDAAEDLANWLDLGVDPETVVRKHRSFNQEKRAPKKHSKTEK